jgi:hypothetical protein
VLVFKNLDISLDKLDSLLYPKNETHSGFKFNVILFIRYLLCILKTNLGHFKNQKNISRLTLGELYYIKTTLNSLLKFLNVIYFGTLRVFVFKNLEISLNKLDILLCAKKKMQP